MAVMLKFDLTILILLVLQKRWDVFTVSELVVLIYIHMCVCVSILLFLLCFEMESHLENTKSAL